MSVAATWGGVVFQFQQLCGQDPTLQSNWGTGDWRLGTDPWEVNDETYINGVPLIIDGDYWNGYLLEVVDRTAGTVRFGVITLFHGGKFTEEGVWTYIHDSLRYPLACGTFFDRTPEADYVIVGKWAVQSIYALADTFFGVSRQVNRVDTDE